MWKGIRKAALEATTGERLFEFIEAVLSKMEGAARVTLRIRCGADKSALGLQPLSKALQKYQKLLLLNVLYKLRAHDCRLSIEHAGIEEPRARLVRGFHDRAQVVLVLRRAGKRRRKLNRAPANFPSPWYTSSIIENFAIVSLAG